MVIMPMQGGEEGGNQDRERVANVKGDPWAPRLAILIGGRATL